MSNLGVPIPGSSSISEFLQRYQHAAGRMLNDEQRQAVLYGEGPLFVMAGPGSGKSEVMVARALKLVLVDGVAPQSLMLTTFTEKAARNLQDRAATRLLAMGYSTSLDDLRVGTLHSLCDRTMREFRYIAYSDSRLLDATEQSFFIYAKMTEWLKKNTTPSFWESFRYLYPQASLKHGPNQWQRVNALVTLFNRIADEDVDLDSLQQSDDSNLQKLAELTCYYHKKLKEEHRCDFSLLQVRFREFLQSPPGKIFLQGAPSKQIPPLKYLLVDEYQDTNPIQEDLYFSMAAACDGNITIVGDDDQAMYRFRGGTVECIVRFAERCGTKLKKKAHPIQLKINYRSLPEITKWSEKVLLAQSEMKKKGARTPKRPMESQRADKVGYQVVSLIAGSTYVDASIQVANLIKHLLDSGRVTDPAHIAILMKSTRESPQNAGPICQALRDLNIPFYNPRSKAFLESEEISAMLGILIELIDGGCNIGKQQTYGRSIETISNFHESYKNIASHHKGIQRYVNSVHDELTRMKPGTKLPVSIRDLFYRVLSLDPFATWQEDPNRTFRFGQLTAILESFSSIEDDHLRVSKEENGRFSSGWLRGVFYPRLLGYLHQASLDDPEDIDYQIVPGKVQIMTVHQSKGLEFPVVIAGSLAMSPKPSDATFLLEDLLVPYARSARELAPADDRAVQDLVRFHYVAYTRAEDALVLFGTQAHAMRPFISLAQPRS